MKVLLFLNSLVTGGTQINALELAGILRRRYEHEIVFAAASGEMNSAVADAGFRHVETPGTCAVLPSPSRVLSLRRVVISEKPDLINAWDWWQAKDAFYGRAGVPLLVTEMTMSVNRTLPLSQLTTFGTPEMVEIAKRAGRSRVELFLPSVDTDLNAPGMARPGALRRAYGIANHEYLLVTVSRFEMGMKGDSIRRTIDAVRVLARKWPIRFLLVGDGEGYCRFQREAAMVNRELTRDAVILCGRMMDPRPAYAAADIVIGMGTSALRGMAFHKPVIVTGINGFAIRFRSEIEKEVMYRGLYGIGDGADRYADEISKLLSSPEARAESADAGRRFVLRYFSLPVAAERLNQLYYRAVRNPPGRGFATYDVIRTTAGAGYNRLKYAVRRIAGAG